MTLPSLSVSVTIVLLNEVLMYALPTAMFLRTLRRRVRVAPSLHGFGHDLLSVLRRSILERPRLLARAFFFTPTVGL